MTSIVRAATGVLAASVLGLGVAAVQPATTACACSCAALTTTQYVDGADLVARVTVEQVGATGSGSSGATVTHRMQVTDVYKGAAGPGIEVHSAQSGASCGLEGLQRGHEYLLFATADGSSWAANLCGGTQTWDAQRAAEVAAVTGPAHSPAPASPGSSTTPATGLDRDQWLAAAGGVVAAVIAGMAGYAWSRGRGQSTGS